MLTKKQLELFGVFARNPFGEFTLQMLKEHSKEKSNNALAIAISQYKQEELIKVRRVGRPTFYSINFENLSVYSYLSLRTIEQLPESVLRTISIMDEEISHTNPFASIILFGSYAVGEEKKGSDIDIALLIETDSGIVPAKIALHTTKRKSLIPLDGHVFTKEEFVQMLQAEEENVGKQIVRKHRVIRNSKAFYDIVRSALRIKTVQSIMNGLRNMK